MACELRAGLKPDGLEGLRPGREGPSLREQALPDRPYLHDPLHYLGLAAPGDSVLARDDHHAIARRQQLLQLHSNALELPEHALVICDHRRTTTVDTRLRCARVSVELDLSTFCCDILAQEFLSGLRPVESGLTGA